jgi:hypothetical protein
VLSTFVITSGCLRGEGDAPGSGRDALVTVTFSCTTVDVTSTKDLSNVVLRFDDGSIQKFDELTGEAGTFAGIGAAIDKAIVTVWIKSGDNQSGDGPGFGERFDAPGASCADPETGPVLDIYVPAAEI